MSALGMHALSEYWGRIHLSPRPQTFGAAAQVGTILTTSKRRSSIPPRGATSFLELVLLLCSAATTRATVALSFAVRELLLW
jgi:hypothetical protein